MTKDGKPYAPQRFKNIVNEIYYITKNSSTPYSDVIKMSVLERQYMVEFISDEIRRENERVERYQQEMAQKRATQKNNISGRRPR